MAPVTLNSFEINPMSYTPGTKPSGSPEAIKTWTIVYWGSEIKVETVETSGLEVRDPRQGSTTGNKATGVASNSLMGLLDKAYPIIATLLSITKSWSP